MLNFFVCFCFSCPLKKKHFDIISDKIIALFPNEEKALYYAAPYSLSPYQTHARGKIRNIYYKTLTEYRNLNMIPKKKKRSIPKRDFHIVKRASVETDGDYNLKLFY